jgi:hypothetical protein
MHPQIYGYIYKVLALFSQPNRLLTQVVLRAWIKELGIRFIHSSNYTNYPLPSAASSIARLILMKLDRLSPISLPKSLL